MKTKNIIKQKNIKTLIEIFKNKQMATKAELAKLSGLSVVTVNSLIKSLLDEEIILESGIVRSELGRPSLLYKFNKVSKLALIVSLHEENNKDTVSCSVHNLCGETIFSIKKQPSRIDFSYLKNLVKDFVEKFPSIKVTGFSIPGVEHEGKFIICDYICLDKNFPSDIKKEFNMEIFFENDINMAVSGYCSSKSLNAAGIYMPSKYPPGSGICVDGKIQKGMSGLAGEIQYLPLGIDWNKFDFSKENIEDFLVKAIKIFMCLYNPQNVLIYSGIDEQILEDKLYKTLKTDNEKLMMPKIITGRDLNEDIKQGMITLALTKII